MAAIPRRSTLARLFHPRGDLVTVGRPDIKAEQWRDHTQALEQLRTWAEARMTETITWYLRDKGPKRWGSRVLRAAAVSSAIAGGVLPLLSGTVGGVNASLGYVFLALAAGCVAFDHFFGLSAGWMRSIATVAALQSRLARFHLDWARWQAAQHGAIAPDHSATAGLELIDAVMTDLATITNTETAQWIADFSNSIATLRQQANPGVTSAQDILTWASQGGLSTD